MSSITSAKEIDRDVGIIGDEYPDSDWEDEDLAFVDIELLIVDMEDNGIISIGDILNDLIVEDLDDNGKLPFTTPLIYHIHPLRLPSLGLTGVG